MRQFHRKTRAGVTLVELLVAIGMILALLAVALPTLKAALSGRRHREASRIVNTFCYAAQAEAARKQLSVGVWIERHSNSIESPDIVSANQCFRLYTAEIPPPYSGDSVGATARITGPGTATFTNSAGITYLCGLGDSIRFNHKGPYYTVTNIAAGPTVSFTHPSAPFPRTGSVVPYTVLRQPMKSSASSIELPKTTTIALSESGIGASGVQFGAGSAGDQTPVVIMFNPNGGIDRVYYQNIFVRPLGTVHLMIGKDGEEGFELFSAQNADGASSAVEFPGGTGVFLTSGSFGAGQAMLQSSPDGSTWTNVIARNASSPPGGTHFRTSGPVQLRVNLTGSSGASLNASVMTADNLSTDDNFLISIGHSTGSITSETNVGSPSVISLLSSGQAAQAVAESRKFARESQTMGGS